MRTNASGERDASRAGAESPRDCPMARRSPVARAAGDDGQRREALGVLLTRYLPALRAHLLRRRIAPDRADDLLQSFVADKVIGSDLLAAADRQRGRFRALLVTALNNYAANQLRHDRAERRAPKDGAVVSLDPSLHQESCPPDDCDPFDVEWAREVIAEALRRTKAEC